MQIPLDRLLLETDAPDGRPRLGEPYQERLLSTADKQEDDQNVSNHPANIRSACISEQHPACPPAVLGQLVKGAAQPMHMSYPFLQTFLSLQRCHVCSCESPVVISNNVAQSSERSVGL